VSFKALNLTRSDSGLSEPRSEAASDISEVSGAETEDSTRCVYSEGAAEELLRNCSRCTCSACCMKRNRLATPGVHVCAAATANAWGHVLYSVNSAKVQQAAALLHSLTRCIRPSSASLACMLRGAGASAGAQFAAGQFACRRAAAVPAMSGGSR
jgi:hypothetical protein